MESQNNKRTPCLFLELKDEKAFCSIYSVRPEGCRLYPIDTDFGAGGVDCPAKKVALNKIKENFKNKDEENKMILEHFYLFKIPFDEKYLMGPYAQIDLGRHSVRDINGNKHRCISPRCVNYNELKEYVEFLKMELDDIAEQGKMYFESEFKKREEWIKQKRKK